MRRERQGIGAGTGAGGPRVRRAGSRARCLRRRTGASRPGRLDPAPAPPRAHHPARQGPRGRGSAGLGPRGGAPGPAEPLPRGPCRAGMLDPDWAGRLSGELSWLAGLLGAARDADVLLAGFERDLARLPDEDAEAGRRLLKRLVAARAADHGRLLAAMEEPRHAALVDDLVAAVRAPAWTPQAGQPATEAVPPLVAGHWRRLRRAVDGAGDHASDEALHRIRIRAKRCRYAAEAAVPVIGEPARAFAKAVERLQEVLGEQ